MNDPENTNAILFFQEAKGILQSNVIKNLAEKILDKNFPRLPEITCAASLAYCGLLNSVDGMRLRGLDLASVPAQHLASLVSCVTWNIEIRSDVSGCDLVSFLDSLKCEWLYVGVSLDSDETKALVRAMESQVVNVRIRDVYGNNMTLDITTLTKYSGKGKCSQIQCYERQFKEDMKTWAMSKKWITNDNTNTGALRLMKGGFSS